MYLSPFGEGRRPVRRIRRIRFGRELSTTLLELAGMVILSVGVGMVALWAGLVSLGLCMILVGALLGRAA